MKEQEKKGKILPEEEFEKTVFKMFNSGMHPNKVIERLGRVDKVVELWGKHCKLMDDDYCQAKVD